MKPQNAEKSICMVYASCSYFSLSSFHWNIKPNKKVNESFYDVIRSDSK